MPVKLNSNNNNRYSPIPSSSTAMTTTTSSSSLLLTTTNNNGSSPTSQLDLLYNEDFNIDPTTIDVTDLCFDEIWSNFIPTPPQSPPLFDCCDDIFNENMRELENELINPNVITHDCMWSGHCGEYKCKSSGYSSNNHNNNGLFSGNNLIKSGKTSMTSTLFRPGTPFNLSTSPQSAFNNFIHASELNMNENYNTMEDDSQQQQQEQQQQISNNSILTTNSNVYAMTNDHSYGSSQQQVQQQKIIISDTNEKSLIQKDTQNIYRKPLENKSIGGQPRLSKIRCKKWLNSSTNRKHKYQTQKQKMQQSQNSLLNNNVTSPSSLSSSSSSSSTNVTKKNFIKSPIVSFSSENKNIQNIKRKNQTQIQPVISATTSTANSSRLIQVKSINSSNISSSNVQLVTTTSNNISNLQLNSPACSDSEESSLSLYQIQCDSKMNEAPPFKRREHNDSERKRRDHLRNSFNNLRDQVPKLKSSEKRPPRIMILHEAKNYVREIIKENEKLELEHQNEIEKFHRLTEMLRRLQE